MSNLKRILITTQSHEFFILRMNGGSQLSGFCADCKKDVRLFTLDEAVSFSIFSTRELIRRIENRIVHSLETESGHWLVCAVSLGENFPKSD